MRRTEKKWKSAGAKWSANVLVASLLLVVAPVLAGDHEGMTGKSALPLEARHRRIVVSIPARELALLEGERVLRVYAVAVGAAVSPSPTGKFRLISRVVDPAYYHEGRVIAPGKANPLGSRWMGLSLKGYGIHGTNEPASIGKPASHGCIRMNKHDVGELFELVRDTVEILASRNASVAKVFRNPEPVAVRAAATSNASPQPFLSGLVLAAMTDQF